MAPLKGLMVSANFSEAARREWQARKLRSSLTTQPGLSAWLAPGSVRELDAKLDGLLQLCPLDAAKTGIDPKRTLAVSLSNIRQFLECPLQGWARFALGLREDEEEEENLREDEPFVSGRPGETVLLRQAFLAAIQKEHRGEGPVAFEAVYDPLFESLARRGLAPVGLFGAVERRKHLDLLARWHRTAREAGLLAAGPFGTCRFGRASESDRSDWVDNAIALDVPLPHSGVKRVEIFGRTEIVAREMPGSITPVVRDDASEKDFLRGFLDAVVFSLLGGGRNPAIHHAYVIASGRGGKSARRERAFRAIDQAQAREFLTNVVADLIGGTHTYLLPFEAVQQFWKNGTAIDDSVETFKEDEYSRCSSEYGPVRDFRRYDPPAEDVARAMIERRFGLFREAGGPSE